ncbi:MAG: L-serine ammonia-lyase [Sphingobacteriales bacterium]|nr:L-serine ammonia-lyase [Sphingobacteriales bacterium]
MAAYSIFDIIKVGVGPSSSHTMGPWQAALNCMASFTQSHHLAGVCALRVHLYGSLAKTGKGHGTDVAVLMGLSGEDYRSIDTSHIPVLLGRIQQDRQIQLFKKHRIVFDPNTDIVFHFNESLPQHPNALSFEIHTIDEQIHRFTYYSVGGGFVVQEGEIAAAQSEASFHLPYPIEHAYEIEQYCTQNNWHIADLVLRNEWAWRSPETVDAQLSELWQHMKHCIWRGCHTNGVLSGGLQVVRRAAHLNEKLLEGKRFDDVEMWLAHIRTLRPSFQQVLKWVSCAALAVNEENAAFGRIVTAPTNGAAGVLPAVLFYYYCFVEGSNEEQIKRFLLVAGEIGSIFKKRATISAAMGGCQAEIGVSSAMAAAALAACCGGTVSQALMAAEIAMEHHLGLTCDPIAGLVQIPCIERNSMGAVKAITAANIALESNPKLAKVSLDAVIKTMWETALDMNHKYKETAEGGLAVNIPVNVSEC